MAFTTITVTGTVESPTGGPAAGAIVTATLSEPITDSSNLVAPLQVQATCNSAGQFAMTLAATDDLTTAPRGAMYTFTAWAGGVQIFGMPPVPLPAASAPTINWMLLWVSAHNLCVNPSFEHDTIGSLPAGWNTGSSATFVASSATSLFGSGSGLLTRKVAGSGNCYIVSNFMPTVAGVTYNYAINAKLMSGPSTGYVFALWTINGYGSTSSALPSLSTNWTSVAGTWTCPASVVATQVVITDDQVQNPQLGNGIYIDAVLFSSDTTMYFDGDMPGCRWAGTAGQSVSLQMG